jgi:hypothetical protein
MDITADTQDGNVIVTIPSGFTNSSEEGREIIRVTDGVRRRGSVFNP